MGVLHSFFIKNIFYDKMDLRLFYFHEAIHHMKICNKFNDTHREKLVRYWIPYKNSLKYKFGCFWRFSYVYSVN